MAYYNPQDAYSGNLLQGGTSPNLQGSSYNPQTTVTPASPSATAPAPARTSYVNRVTQPKKNPLASYKYEDDPTVFRSDNDSPFSSADQFLQAGGDFGSVEVRQRPQTTAAPITAPTTQPAANKTPAKSAYLSYLEKFFDPEAAETASGNINELNKRTSEELLRARETEDVLRKNEIGQLEGGQRYGLNENARLSNRSLGDLALSKGYQQDYLDRIMGAGKELYGYEQEQAKQYQPFEADKPLVRLNQETGEYETVFTPPEEALGFNDYPTSYQEYMLAQQGGFSGSYNDYQTMDANRKRSISQTNYIGGQLGLTGTEANLFNNIITKYNASPLIAAADRASALASTIQGVKANPNDGARQLNLVYQYIGALDNYQSAVREGELALVGSLQSKIGGVQKAVDNIYQTGKPVDAKTAQAIASAAQDLVNIINQNAQRKAQSFASQANTLGLGDAWSQYTGGFNPSYGGAENDPLGLGL